MTRAGAPPRAIRPRCAAGTARRWPAPGIAPRGRRTARTLGEPPEPPGAGHAGSDNQTERAGRPTSPRPAWCGCGHRSAGNCVDPPAVAWPAGPGPLRRSRVSTRLDAVTRRHLRVTRTRGTPSSSCRMDPSGPLRRVASQSIRVTGGIRGSSAEELTMLTTPRGWRRAVIPFSIMDRCEALLTWFDLRLWCVGMS